MNDLDGMISIRDCKKDRYIVPPMPKGEFHNLYVLCQCGEPFLKKGYPRHLKSKKHQKLMDIRGGIPFTL